MARQRGNRWQADLTIDGKRVRKSYATKAEAVAAETNNLIGRNPTAAEKTLGGFFDIHFASVWPPNKTKWPNTVRHNFNVIFRQIPRETMLTAINFRMINEAIQVWTADGMAGGTVNRKLSNLSKLLRHAVMIEALDRMPVFKKETEGKHRELTWSIEDEVKAFMFMEHAGLRECALLCQFLLYTGCRWSEAFKLDVTSDVEFPKPGQNSFGYVTFRGTKDPKGRYISRTVPLVPKAEKALKEMMVLSGNAPRPFGTYPYRTFKQHWDKVREHFYTPDQIEAGEAKEFVPHMLRHTCCTRLVRGGTDFNRVMNWMGHTSPQVMRKYVNLIPKDLDTAAKILS